MIVRKVNIGTVHFRISLLISSQPHTAKSLEIRLENNNCIFRNTLTNVNANVFDILIINFQFFSQFINNTNKIENNNSFK